MADVTFKDNSIKVKDALADAAIAYLYEASVETVSQTARNTPVGAGQLKGSWSYQLNEDELESQVGSPLENAIWEEFGTGEHALKGNGRKTPWYVPVDGYKGKKKPSFNGKVIIVHGKNGKDYYKTNGKKPKRMLWNAFQTLKPKLIKRAESIFKELNNK